MSKKTAAVFVIAAGILWGIISIFINKLSVLNLTSIEISFLRVVICGVLMFLLLLVYNRQLLRIRFKDLWMFIGTGIISLTFFSCCYFTTIIRVEASIAVALLYTSPVFIMLMSALIFKEKITSKKIAGSLLTVLGCAFISGIVTVGKGMTFSSLLIGIGAGFFYALYSIFGRFATGKYHPFTITFYTFVFASIGFLFFVNPIHVFQTLSFFPDSFLLVIVWGLLCGVLPYIFYTTGLKHLDTTSAGILVAVEPLVGSIIGIVGFHESSDLLKLLGIALILASIILLSIEPKKRNG